VLVLVGLAEVEVTVVDERVVVLTVDELEVDEREVVLEEAEEEPAGVPEKVEPISPQRMLE
jgi:hypothetical protein